MAGFYSVYKVFTPGEILTAADLNASEQQHVTYQTAVVTEGYSQTLQQSRIQEASSTLASSVADELARLREKIRLLGGKQYWDEVMGPPPSTLETGVVPLHLKEVTMPDNSGGNNTPPTETNRVSTGTPPAGAPKLVDHFYVFSATTKQYLMWKIAVPQGYKAGKVTLVVKYQIGQVATGKFRIQAWLAPVDDIVDERVIIPNTTTPYSTPDIVVPTVIGQVKEARLELSNKDLVAGRMMFVAVTFAPGTTENATGPRRLMLAWLEFDRADSVAPLPGIVEGSVIFAGPTGQADSDPNIMFIKANQNFALFGPQIYPGAIQVMHMGLADAIPTGPPLPETIHLWNSNGGGVNTGTFHVHSETNVVTAMGSPTYAEAVRDGILIRKGFAGSEEEMMMLEIGPTPTLHAGGLITDFRIQVGASALVVGNTRMYVESKNVVIGGSFPVNNSAGNTLGMVAGARPAASVLNMVQLTAAYVTGDVTRTGLEIRDDQENLYRIGEGAVYLPDKLGGVTSNPPAGMAMVYVSNATLFLRDEFGNDVIVGKFENPMTTAGDLIVGGIGGVPGRIAIGADGQVLTMIAGMPNWADASGGFTNPMTSPGDLIVGGVAGTPGRLPVNVDGEVLTLVGGLPAWQTVPPGFTNPMTTAGDIIVGDVGGVATRLAKGADTQVLTMVAGALAWQAPTSGGMTNPMTTSGDIIFGGASGTPTRLPKGTDTHVLTLVSGVPAWVVAPGAGGGMSNPMTGLGDIIYGQSGGTPTRLTPGSNGQFLMLSVGVPVWVDSPGFSNPMTTAGDLIRGGTSGVPTRLAIGGNGTYLGVTAGALAYSIPPGFANPMTNTGDMIRGGVSGAPTRLAAGSNGQWLTMTAGIPTWTALPVDPGFANPMTAAGDLIIGGAGGAPIRLAKLTDGLVLTLASGAPTWAAPASPLPLTTRGDLLTMNATPAQVRLPVGTSGQVLSSTVSGDVAWITLAGAGPIHIDLPMEAARLPDGSVGNEFPQALERISTGTGPAGWPRLLEIVYQFTPVANVHESLIWKTVVPLGANGNPTVVVKFSMLSLATGNIRVRVGVGLVSDNLNNVGQVSIAGSATSPDVAVPTTAGLMKEVRVTITGVSGVDFVGSKAIFTISLMNGSTSNANEDRVLEAAWVEWPR